MASRDGRPLVGWQRRALVAAMALLVGFVPRDSSR